MVNTESLCESPFGTFYESRLGESFVCPGGFAISVFGGTVHNVGFQPDHRVLIGRSWVHKQELSSSRTGLQGAALNNEAWSFAGDAGARNTTLTESYSLDTDSWTQRQPDLAPRADGAACSINGELAVVSGGSGFEVIYENVALHRPGFRPTFGPNLPVGRSQHTSFALGDSAYVYGGLEEGRRGSRSSVYRFTPGTLTWVQRNGGDRRNLCRARAVEPAYPTPTGPQGQRAFITGGSLIRDTGESGETIFYTDIRTFMDDDEGGTWATEAGRVGSKWWHIAEVSRTAVYMISGYQDDVQPSGRTIRYDIHSKITRFDIDMLIPIVQRAGSAALRM